jgi:hypothetical protein
MQIGRPKAGTERQSREGASTILLGAKKEK